MGDDNRDGQKKDSNLEQEFIESTTLHGVLRIAGKSRPIWIRLVWALAFLACFGVCFWQIYLRTKAYTSYEVNTKVTRVYQQELAFPAVTICNFNR